MKWVVGQAGIHAPPTKHSPLPLRREHADGQHPLRLPHSPIHPSPSDASTPVASTHFACPPPPIHPSPLLGGRLGGGWEAASQPHRSRRAPSPVLPAPPPPSFPRPLPRPSRAPSPSFLRRQEPTHPHIPCPSPIHPSPLLGVSCKMPNFGGSADQALSGRHPRAGPRSATLQETPFRGEVRWGVGGSEPTPPIAPRPLPRLSRAPSPSLPRRQEPTHPLPQFIPPPSQREGGAYRFGGVLGDQRVT